MKAQGHSIEEQWDLSEQFEATVDHSLWYVTEQFISHFFPAAETPAEQLTAATVDLPTDGFAYLSALWTGQTNDVFAPFIYGTYDSAQLGLAHDILAQSTLPPGMGIPGVPDHYTADFVKQTANKMVNIKDDLWKNINEELAKGVIAGEGPDLLADRVRQAAHVTAPRAQATARTTVVGASNAGSFALAALVMGPGDTKEWLATEDMRTRPDHAHADGQKVPIDSFFIVGSSPMQRPGDPTAPAGEVVNCRCTMVYNLDEPTTICGCEQGALTAAYAPTVVPTGTTNSCLCPSHVATSQAAPTSFTGAQQYDIFKKFKDIGPISPAYGGAKIYKQLAELRKILPEHATGALEATDLQLLDAIDSQYALGGGKNSFKEKYEEWLHSQAGKKQLAKDGVVAPKPTLTVTKTKPISMQVPKTPPTPAPDVLPTNPISAKKGLPPQPLQPLATDIAPDVVAPRGLDVVAKPDVMNLQKTGDKLGGVSGAQVLQDTSTGEKWIFKTSNIKSELQPKLDVGTAKLQAKMGLKQPSTYTIRYDGKYGSIQSMHDAKAAFPHGKFVPEQLTNSEVLDIQQEQVLDWLISNNDAHTGNFLELTNGKIVGIDKGQAFKYLGQDTHFDWNKVVHSPIAPEKPVYQTLWKAYAEGNENVTLFDPATGALHDIIKKTMSIPDDEFKALFRPYAEQAFKEGKLSGGKTVDDFLDNIVVRKNNLQNEFDSAYTKATAQRAKILKKAPPEPTPIVPSPAVAPDQFAPLNLKTYQEMQSPLELGAQNQEDLKFFSDIFANEFASTSNSTTKDAFEAAKKKFEDYASADTNAVHTLQHLHEEDLIHLLKIQLEHTGQHGFANAVGSLITVTPEAEAPGGFLAVTALKDLAVEDQHAVSMITSDFVQYMKGKPSSFVESELQHAKDTAHQFSGSDIFDASDEEIKHLVELSIKESGYSDEEVGEILKGLGKAPTPAAAPVTNIEGVTDFFSLSKKLQADIDELFGEISSNLNGLALNEDNFNAALATSKHSFELYASESDIFKFSDEELKYLLKLKGDASDLQHTKAYKAMESFMSPPANEAAATITPGTIDALDISGISQQTADQFLKIFKQYKPVTPNWGGSAIFKNLQAVKQLTVSSPDLANLSDGQLLKILDKAFGGKGDKTYFDETAKWLQTPAGKKYALNEGVSTTSITQAPAGAGTAGLTTAAESGDITAIPAAVKKAVFQSLKSNQVYLSTPPQTIWDKIQIIKYQYKNTNAIELSDLQALKILDEETAEKLGTANLHSYEEKVVNWLKTPSGKKYATENAGKVPKVTKSPSYSTPGSSSSGAQAADVPTYGSKFVSDMELPTNIATDETTFDIITIPDAFKFDDRMPPLTASQKKALYDYTSSQVPFNGPLRFGNGVSENAIKKIREAQKGMAPSDRPMLLHRGTDGTQFGLNYSASLSDIQALVGKTLQDRGFISSSVGGTAGFNRSVIMEIEAPTGTMMRFLEPFSAYKGGAEKEMLLAAGTKYKVISATQKGSKIFVRVRVVP